MKPPSVHRHNEIGPCNECGTPIYFCEELGEYYHADPTAEPCFLDQTTHDEDMKGINAEG